MKLIEFLSTYALNSSQINSTLAKNFVSSILKDSNPYNDEELNVLTQSNPLSARQLINDLK